MKKINKKIIPEKPFKMMKIFLFFPHKNSFSVLIKAEKLQKITSQSGVGKSLYNNSDSTEFFSAISNGKSRNRYNTNFNADENLGGILYKSDNLEVENIR